MQMPFKQPPHPSPNHDAFDIMQLHAQEPQAQAHRGCEKHQAIVRERVCKPDNHEQEGGAPQVGA